MTDSTREPVLNDLEIVWASVAELGATLSDAEWSTPSELPGWTVKDCMSHMAGVELGLLGEPVPEVDVDHLAHVTNPFAAMIEVWVEAFRERTGPEVLELFVDATRRRLEAMAAYTEDDWARLGWSPVGEAPYRTFMEVRVFDCWMHEQDIRRVTGRPGGMHRGAELTVDRLGKTLGFVVGKRVGAPDGTTVVVEVTGPYPRTFAIEVAGRAQSLEQPPADPTVRLTMDLEAFAALCGGRWNAERALTEARVSVAGDTDLAGRILGAIATTP